MAVDNRKAVLVKNTFIIAAGKMSTQIVALLLLPLYTMYLSPAEYGAVDLILTYVVLFAPLISLQFEMAAFRLLIEARGNHARVTSVISTSFAFVFPIVAVVLTASFILASLFNFPYAYLGLSFIGVAVLNNLLMQFARGLGENKKFALSSVISGFSAIVLNILFIVYLGMGASGMLLAMLLANVVASIYLIFALRILSRFRMSSVDATIRSEMIKYSLPLIPNGLSWWVINAADRTIISIILGISANGIYAIAFKFPLIFTTLFSFFGLSWTESAALHINSKDRDVYFSGVANASMKVFGSIGLLIISSAPIIFILLIDSQFMTAQDYVPLLIIGALFNAVVGIYSAVYIAKKLTRKVMNTSILAAFVNIVLTLLLINYIGLYGAAISSAVAFMSMAIFRHFDVKKYVNITYEKHLFVVLGLLYAVVITLYYLHSIWASIAGLAVAVIASLILNRNAGRVLFKKVMSLKKLS